jgi:hypothetical protein
MPFMIKEAAPQDLSTIITLAAQSNSNQEIRLTLEDADQLLTHMKSYPDYSLFVIME